MTRKYCAITPEVWRAACENAGIGPCVKCDSPLHNRLAFWSEVRTWRHKEHLPDVGDLECVLAMFEAKIEMLERDGAKEGWWARSIDGYLTHGSTPAAAIVLACAALPKEDSANG